MRLGLDARHAARGLGIGVFVECLAAELGSSGEFDVVWFGAAERAPRAVREVQAISGWPYPLLDTALGKRLVARSGVDVMHFTGNTGWTSAGPVPFVLTIHDLIFARTGLHERSLRQVVGHRYARWNVRRTIRHAAAVTAPTRAAADDIVAVLEPARRPVVINQGVDELPPNVGIDGGRRYVLTFGGRDPRKRLDLALEGWRMASVPHQLKVLAGAGIPDGFEAEVSAEIAAGRLELVEYVPRDELWRLIANSDAVLYPSSAEGFGLPVIEAMAAGVPCVAGLAPATIEVGGDAIARIDPAAPAQSIASQLRRIVDDAGYRDAIIERGRERAREYGWRRAAARYSEVYRSMTA